MRITLISRSWPPHERTGVSLSALCHARLLLKMGHEVSVIGATNDLQLIPLPLTSTTNIACKGSGALYSPVQIDYCQLKNAIATTQPNLVIVEAWQTALTDTAIEASFDLNIPVLMISHGISLHPHQLSIRQLVRSLAWLPYRYFKLPSLIKKLSAITALDISSPSKRFYDRYLAIRANVPIIALKNFPNHRLGQFIPRDKRKKQLLVVGYFSEIKNQLTAINVLSHLPEDFSCLFVGERTGEYFNRCLKRVAQLRLDQKVSFLQDRECDLANEIAQSFLVFSPSITEALPITLIEAMAAGTPFVATPVGAVPSLAGGILAKDMKSQVSTILNLISHNELWEKYSELGLAQYAAEFTERHVYEQLNDAVTVATGKKR